MKTGRKTAYEEWKVKEYLGEITPKMFAFVKDILDNGTKAEKMKIIEKIMPKVIDKALPNQLEGDFTGEFKFIWAGQPSFLMKQESGQIDSTNQTSDGTSLSPTEEAEKQLPQSTI